MKRTTLILGSLFILLGTGCSSSGSEPDACTLTFSGPASGNVPCVVVGLSAVGESSVWIFQLGADTLPNSLANDSLSVTLVVPGAPGPGSFANASLNSFQCVVLDTTDSPVYRADSEATSVLGTAALALSGVESRGASESTMLWAPHGSLDCTMDAAGSGPPLSFRADF